MYSIDQEQTHPQMRQTPMDNLPQQYQNPGAPNVQQIPTNLGQKGVEYEGRIYSLEVVQQPIRARMCGFGDKVRFSAQSSHIFSRTPRAAICGAHLLAPCPVWR